MKNKAGFSLTDLVVTLVVVAIIAIVAVPIYRGYVKKGIATEGNSLLGEINAAQQIYYTRHGQYFGGTAGQSFSRSLGISTEKAKYFKTWRIDSSVDSSGNAYFTATTTSSKGHQMTLTGSSVQTGAGEDKITDNTSYDD